MKRLLVILFLIGGGCDAPDPDEMRQDPELDGYLAELQRLVLPYEARMEEFRKTVRNAKKTAEDRARIGKGFDEAIKDCSQVLEGFGKVKAPNPEIEEIKSLHLRAMEGGVESLKIQKRYWLSDNELEKDVLRRKKRDIDKKMDSSQEKARDLIKAYRFRTTRSGPTGAARMKSRRAEGGSPSRADP